MALIFLASIAGAPGATTTALMLAAQWPRAVMVVEADLSRPSSILPGFYRGQQDHSKGLTSVAIAHQNNQLEPEALWSQALQYAPNRFLVPGFSTIAGAAGSTPAFWSKLAQTFTGLEGSGVDVIIDAGRYGFKDPRGALLQQADFIGLVTKQHLPDVAAIASRRDDINAELAGVDHAERIRLILVEDQFKGYTNKEIADVVGIPVLTTLPWHPRTAAVVSLGEPANRSTTSSALTRSVAVLSSAIIVGVINAHRNRLGSPANQGAQS
jgi:hypothetical protein